MKKAKKYYKLYFSKKDGELKLKLMKPSDTIYRSAYLHCNEENPLYRFNNCYYLSCDRKELKKYAMSLQLKWIQEAKDNLEFFENVKIGR